MKFNEKITMLRITNGYSLQELSDRLNVTREELFEIEVGAGVPSMELTKKLALELEVTLEVLLNDEIDLVVKKDTETTKKVKHIDEQAGRIISWSIAGFFLIPITTIALTLLIMLVGIGGLFVGLLPVLTLFAMAGAIYSIAHPIINDVSTAEFIICVGGAFIGMGLIYPLYKASIQWFKKYRSLSKDMINKIKNLKLSEWVK